jgi:hypothetical protein
MQIEPNPLQPGQKRILITPSPTGFRRFKVYASNDLSAGGWQLIWNQTAAFTTLQDPGSEGQSRRFYKVEVTLP